MFSKNVLVGRVKINVLKIVTTRILEKLMVCTVPKFPDCIAIESEINP